MSAALPSLAFAGIGLMGLPMCRRLLAAGYPLTVLPRAGLGNAHQRIGCTIDATA